VGPALRPPWLEECSSTTHSGGNQSAIGVQPSLFVLAGVFVPRREGEDSGQLGEC
jgi:hypothetical protein